MSSRILSLNHINANRRLDCSLLFMCKWKIHRPFSWCHIVDRIAKCCTHKAINVRQVPVSTREIENPCRSYRMWRFAHFVSRHPIDIFNNFIECLLECLFNLMKCVMQFRITIQNSAEDCIHKGEQWKFMKILHKGLISPTAQYWQKQRLLSSLCAKIKFFVRWSFNLCVGTTRRFACAQDWLLVCIRDV